MENQGIEEFRKLINEINRRENWERVIHCKAGGRIRESEWEKEAKELKNRN